MKIPLVSLLALFLAVLFASRPHAYPGKRAVMAVKRPLASIQAIKREIEINLGRGFKMETSSQFDYYLFTIGKEPDTGIVMIGVLGNWLPARRSFPKWGNDEDILFLLLLGTLSFVSHFFFPFFSFKVFSPGLTRPWSLFLHGFAIPDISSYFYFMISFPHTAGKVRDALGRDIKLFYAMMFLGPAFVSMFEMILTRRRSMRAMGTTALLAILCTYGALNDPRERFNLLGNPQLSVGYLTLLVLHSALYMVHQTATPLVRLALPLLACCAFAAMTYQHKHPRTPLVDAAARALGVDL